MSPRGPIEPHRVDASPVYPAPTIVVGVGRLGLAVLERLGEDWRTLSLAGGDPSLANLRLLHVRPRRPGLESDETRHEDGAWGRREEQVVAIARYVGESDLPSLAVDLMILRSLGLVRFRDGSYQVAVPQDGGVVQRDEAQAGSDPKAPDESRDDGETPSDGHPTGGALPKLGRTELVRRRYFDWRDLGPDPIVAVERLHRLAERATDLDLFITPILSRVRQGHSPRTLLSCIARCAALAEGRDPSPWPWLWERLQGLRQAAEEDQRSEPDIPEAEDGGAALVAEDGVREPGETEEELRVRVRGEDLVRARSLFGLAAEDLPRAIKRPRATSRGNVETSSLDGFAESPLPSWDAVMQARETELCERVWDGAVPDLVLRIPAPFLPRKDDPRASLQPRELLKVDWETTGWATEGFRPEDYVVFEPAPASAFRLGLFDHDDTPGSRRRHRQLAPRLIELSRVVHRGLVRLWVDLQRERVEERDPALDDRRREGDEEALHQSLEILGEMLVRPLSREKLGDSEDPAAGHSSEGRKPDRRPGCRPEGADTRLGLPERPTQFLSGLSLPEPGDDSAPGALESRLTALGLGDSASRGSRRPLLRDIELGPEDSEPPPGMTIPRPGRPKPRGLQELGRALNKEARDLFDFDFLTTYRDRPSRRPPRLTVYLVGDLSELFVRASMRIILREVHSELLRAFTPILESFREGFDRGLSVVPILWMPHPADPFEGRSPEYGRCEEAAIIDAVHGIRRWVESVIPSRRRRVSQIFINSRVTDKAVLQPREAARQTRDFITLQIRNDIAQDDWLRTTAEGPRGDDFFACFSCYEIDFPAEKAREYLANRLGRDCLQRLRQGRRVTPPEVATHLFRPPELQVESRLARERLRETVTPVARQVAERVENRIEVSHETPRWRIYEAFNQSFSEELAADIQLHWRDLTENQGVVDSLVDRLSSATSDLLSERVIDVRKESDRLIEERAGTGGLQSALAGFQELRGAAREQLQAAEDERRRREDVATRHETPETRSLESARHGVCLAIGEVPDWNPMRAGLLAWLMAAPALGAPLAHSVAHGFDFPGLLERALGPWGVIPGGAVLFLAVWGALRFYRKRKLSRVRGAVRRMAGAARRILEGEGRSPDQESMPSILSFFESRLMLTESLAGRGFALRVFHRMEADGRLADRLSRSIDVQLRRLTQRAEELGVRPRLAEGPDAAAKDDLSSLFATRSGERIDRLVEPERMGEHYERWVGGGGEVTNLVPRFIAEAGGLGAWRETACLSDSEKLLDVGRRELGDVASIPLPDQHRFADEVGERLCRFAERIYPNLGFGAKFSGYEGLDPDGVQVQAEAALVLHPQLEKVYRLTAQRAGSQNGGFRSAKPVFDVVTTEGLRPNTAYMLSLAQGIRAHSVYNLKRFESFHGRPHMSYHRAFPVSGETDSESLNPLTAYRDVARDLLSRLNGSKSRDPGGESGTGGAS